MAITKEVFPEFYIKGQQGYFNTHLMQDGYSCCGFRWAGKVQTWKSRGAAERWLVRAREIDESASIVDNTIVRETMTEKEYEFRRDAVNNFYREVAHIANDDNTPPTVATQLLVALSLCVWV